MDTTNYKQTSFGLYVPAHIAEQINHLDMSTVACYESHLRNSGKASSTIEKYSRFIRLFTVFSATTISQSPMFGRGWTASRKPAVSIRSTTRSRPSTACSNGWGGLIAPFPSSRIRSRSIGKMIGILTPVTLPVS